MTAGSIVLLIVLVLMLVLYPVMMMRKNKKEQERQKTLIESLKPGEYVLTYSQPLNACDAIYALQDSS